MEAYLIIGAASILGAIVQATMGFGTTLVLLNVVPLFFPLNKAIALIQASIIVLNLVFTVVYIKKVRWDVVWPALIPGFLLGLVFTLWSVQMDVSALTIALGIVLIMLSVYEIALKNSVKVKPSKTTGFIMGSLSGIGNAFFSLAGPPIALYLIPSIDDNLEYFATSQCFFLISSISCIAARIFSGVYERSDLPLLAVMASCLLVGIAIGLKILKKIDGKLLRKLIYGFIGLNGIYIIVKQLV